MLCIRTWILVTCINLSFYGDDDLDYLFFLLSSDGLNSEVCTCNTSREFYEGKYLLQEAFVNEHCRTVLTLLGLITL